MKHLGVPHLQECLDTARPVESFQLRKYLGVISIALVVSLGMSVGVLALSHYVTGHALSTTENSTLSEKLSSARFFDVQIEGMTNGNPDDLDLQVTLNDHESWENYLSKNELLLSTITEMTTLDKADVTLNNKVATIKYKNWDFSEEGQAKIKKVQDVLPAIFYEHAGTSITYELVVDLEPERPMLTLTTTTDGWYRVSAESQDPNNIFAIAMIHFAGGKFDKDTGIDYTLVNTLVQKDTPTLNIVSTFRTYSELKAKKTATIPDANAGMAGFIALKHVGRIDNVTFTTGEELKDASLVAIYKKEETVTPQQIKEQFNSYWLGTPQVLRQAPYRTEARFDSPEGEFITDIRR